MVSAGNVRLPRVADHDRLGTARVGVLQGIVENGLMRLLHASIFRKDDPLKERIDAGTGQLARLHLAKAIGKDENAVRGAQIAQQVGRAADQPALGGGALEEIAINVERGLSALDAKRTQNIQEALDDERLAIDLAIPVFGPQVEIVRHIKIVECLKGGIMPIEMIIGIQLFEAFPIVVTGIPKGIVEIKEEVLVAHGLIRPRSPDIYPGSRKCSRP